MLGAHRAVVEIEREIADPVLFPICYLAERSMVGQGVDRKHGFGKTRRHRSECLRGRKFNARGDTRNYIAVLALSSRFRKDRKVTQILLDSGFKMGDPKGAIDRASAYGTIPLRENLSGRSFEVILLVGAVEEIASAVQGIQHSRRAISGADFSYDDFGQIPAPVDAAVALAHGRAKTPANIDPVVIERLGPKFEEMRAAFDSPNGWGAIMKRYAEVAEAA